MSLFSRTRLTALVLLSLTSLTAVGSAFAQTPNRPVTSSPIQDQGYVGYCWSYATMAMIEGEALKSGKQVVLSPEYVGFYQMYSEMKANWGTYRTFARKKPPRKLIGRIVQGIAKTIVRSLFAPNEGAPSLMTPFERIKTVGVVPETVFRFKVGRDQQGLEDRVGRFITDKLLLKPQLDAYEQNEEQLFSDFAAAYGAKPPKPTDTFVHEGKSYTAKSFLSDYLRFNPDAYVEYKVGPENHDRMIRSMKQALAADRSAMIGFIIYEDFDTMKRTGSFDEKQCANAHCTKPVGGHAVLAVNTQEDDTGRQPMDSVVIKNSWGLQGLDHLGQPTTRAEEKGFNRITNGYLRMTYPVPVAAPSATPSGSPSPAPSASPPPVREWMLLLPKGF